MSKHVYEDKDIKGAESPYAFEAAPLRADPFEELDGVDHAVFGFVFEQRLVVLRERGHEHHRVHVVEAVDPLLPLVLLPPHVVHAKRRVFHRVLLRGNPRSSDTAQQHLFDTRYVARLNHLNRIKGTSKQKKKKQAQEARNDKVI